MGISALTSACFLAAVLLSFCNKLIISVLSKTFYFCEKPAQRWSQLREIDSQALFFVSFSNNFLLSWRLILFLPLLFFVCLLPVCLLPFCLPPCLLASRLLASPSAGFSMQLLCSCPCLVPPSSPPCPVLLPSFLRPLYNI